MKVKDAVFIVLDLSAHVFDDFTQLLIGDLARRMPWSGVAETDTRHRMVVVNLHDLRLTTKEGFPPLTPERLKHLRVIVVTSGHEAANTGAFEPRLCSLTPS